MQSISQFTLSSYRSYRISLKPQKNLSIFPPKNTNDYLDYSVDFSRLLEDGEKLLSGDVKVQEEGVVIENIHVQPTILTAFISGGMPNRSFYLVFTARTDKGNILIQEMILPTYGQNIEKEAVRNYFVSLKPDIKPPKQRPPLNAIKINDRYLFDDNGFFIGI